VPAILVAIEILADFLLALALAYYSLKILQAVTGPLVNAAGHIPGVGPWLSGQIESMAKALNSFLNNAVKGIDKLIGWSWHLLANWTDKLWAEIKSHAHYLGLLSPIIAQLVWMVSHLHTRVNGLHSIGKGINDAIGKLEKAWHGIEHRVGKIEREIGQGIGHDLRLQVKGLEKELGKVEHVTIPGLRQGIATAEGDVTALQKWIAHNIPLPGTADFAAAVAVAIAALGIFPRGCTSWGKFFNRGACGLWNGLEDLLGLLADLFLFTHFCDLWAAATPFLGVFLDPLVAMIATFADGACSHRPDTWRTIGAPLHTPTAAEITHTISAP